MAWHGKTHYGTSCSNDRTYMRNFMTRAYTDYERRRRCESGFGKENLSVSTPEHTLPLKVEIADFCPLDNAQVHNTDKFEIVRQKPASPVFRRGQPFYMTIHFNRQYDENQDIIKLVFNFGPYPAVTQGTQHFLTIKKKNEFSANKNQWGLQLKSADCQDVTLQNTDDLHVDLAKVYMWTSHILGHHIYSNISCQPELDTHSVENKHLFDLSMSDSKGLVFIPVTSQVGVWHCSVLTTRNDQTGCSPSEYVCPENIYILFNPWCKDDQVYMERDDWREEYVLNDEGKVWMGSHRQPIGRHWIFGQYDDVILPTVMTLLGLSRCFSYSERGNAVKMVRVISAVINAQDENGLIEENWGEGFSGGVNPCMWTGSVAIMETYLRDHGQPVKYGQCWVYSALVVTVCRALGIPCRSVTNYVSARDTDCSLTIDKFFSKDGELIERGPIRGCGDSIWSFHVWNEVWMSRADLPVGYGGWQVIDATPQERSEGLYRCGPASVEAIRKGQVGLAYDVPFIFSEVNADIFYFIEDENSEWGFTRTKCVEDYVGRLIVTKAIGRCEHNGQTDAEDITTQYKSKEGSREERLTMYKAVSGIDRTRLLYSLPKKEQEDVSFDLVEIDSIIFGEPFEITVHVQNKSNSNRTVSLILSASSIRYTGATAYKLKRVDKDMVLHPCQQETVKVKVEPKEYIGKVLLNPSIVKLYAIGTVAETNQTWSEEDDFPLPKPKLSVELKGKLKIACRCDINLSFQNPLNIPLTDCSYSIEGFGIQRPKINKCRDIQPKELVTITETLQPNLAGKRSIVGTFMSKQLAGVTGSTSCTIDEYAVCGTK